MNSTDRMRLSENAHLPFGRLTALSQVEGLRYPSPPALLNSRYASRRSRFNRASHCGVLLCTPHSSGFVRASLGLPTLRAGPRFRKLPSRKRDLRQSGISQSSTCIWTFSISLSEAGFSTVSMARCTRAPFQSETERRELCRKLRSG
jgi:hypothetical protein